MADSFILNYCFRNSANRTFSVTCAAMQTFGLIYLIPAVPEPDSACWTKQPAGLTTDAFTGNIVNSA